MKCVEVSYLKNEQTHLMNEHSAWAQHIGMYEKSSRHGLRLLYYM